jgi:regulator of replication initiation timing
MDNEVLIPEELIMNKIFFIRGQSVMLDSSLAELYSVETKQLKRQVKRNIERFPEDFMFELTNEELNNLRCQIGTSSWGGTRYLPMEFTEYGVLMLSSVLSSDKAIQANIQIMRIFARIRKMLVENTDLRLEIEKIKNNINNQIQNIELVFKYLDELITDRESLSQRNPIGFIIPQNTK